jgi:hypothetical protein
MYYLFYFFQNIWNYVLQFFLKKQKAIENTNSPLDSTKIYVEKHKNSFIDLLKTQTKYNENVDDVFYNKEKYKETFQEENNEIEKKWKTRIIFENTPRGNVILHYNPYKMAFSYYCDQSVSYDILNAISMKYVKLYRCMDFFMDEIILSEHYTSPLIKIHVKEEPKEKKNIPDVKNGPFIKTKPKPTKNEDAPTSSAPKKQLLNRNCFQYLGKISNFTFLQLHKKKQIGFRSPLIEKLSYKDYKRLLST